jgi:hypothetical protein
MRRTERASADMAAESSIFPVTVKARGSREQAVAPESGGGLVEDLTAPPSSLSYAHHGKI